MFSVPVDRCHCCGHVVDPFKDGTFGINPYVPHIHNRTFKSRGCDLVSLRERFNRECLDEECERVGGSHF
jgi:hypothetical protein